MPIGSRVLAAFTADVAGTVSVPVTSTAVNGEFLTATVFTSYSANGTTISMPGWTAFGSPTLTGGFNPNGYLFYKRAGGSEPSSYSLVTNITAADSTNVVIAAHTSVDITNPIAALPVWATGGDTSGTAPSVTPAASPSRAFWGVANQEFTDPPTRVFNWSASTKLTDSLSNWCFAGMSYEDRTATSATGTRAWTAPSYGGNTPATAFGFALREATTPSVDYSDRLNQPFSSGGLSSTYHIYADGLDEVESLGLLIYFHGDGGYDFDQENDFPDDYYALPGPLGVVEQGRSRGLVTVAVRTPDSDDTWWTDGSNNATYVNALINSLDTEYGFDRSRMWFAGYSGGAQFITQFLLPKYPTICTGGGSIVFGGGGAPISPSNPTFSSTLKSNFPMVWYTGQRDLPVNSPGEGYDGHGEAVDGAAWYANNGFTVFEDYPENVDHLDLEYKFGPVVGYYMERVAWGELTSSVGFTFDSSAGTTSGTWTRVTSTPAPYAGVGALQSANVGSSATTDGVLAVPSGAIGMRFRYRVNTAEYQDLFWVGVGSDFQPMTSGTSPYGWSESAPLDVSGASSVTFRVKRDGGSQTSNSGSPANRVTVDSVIFEYPFVAPTGPEPGRFFLAL